MAIQEAEGNLKKKKEKAYIIIFRDKEIIHDSRKELK